MAFRSGILARLRDEFTPITHLRASKFLTARKLLEMVSEQSLGVERLRWYTKYENSFAHYISPSSNVSRHTFLPRQL